MSLRRLLGLSAAAAAVPGGLRCSLATAAAHAHPPWAVVKRWAAAAADESAPGPGALVHLDRPPYISALAVPKHLIRTKASPDPDSDDIQLLSGSVHAASADGLLLLAYYDSRLTAPILARKGTVRLRKEPTDLRARDQALTHLVCNPVTGELCRLQDVIPSPVSRLMCGKHMGLLTRGHDGDGDGAPDRFAVAELQENLMVRFLSETGKWDAVAVSTCQLPRARHMVLDRNVVAFGGRLWWLDATCGAISADPFSDRPELRFVELPHSSLLPAAAARDSPDCDELWGCGASEHRRLCVSQGRLRYVEVSQEEPFLLISYVLDEEGGGWTLEYLLDLNRYEAHRYGHPWLPLKGGNTPHIGFLDPLNANVMHMSASITTLENTPQVLFMLDMKKGYPTRSSAYRSGDDPSFVPCVLPPWLGLTQILSAGKKDFKRNKTLADVLVRADNP